MAAKRQSPYAELARLLADQQQTNPYYGERSRIRNTPVYSVGQGIADATGDIVSAYFEKAAQRKESTKAEEDAIRALSTGTNTAPLTATSTGGLSDPTAPTNAHIAKALSDPTAGAGGMRGQGNGAIMSGELPSAQGFSAPTSGEPLSMPMTGRAGIAPQGGPTTFERAVPQTLAQRLGLAADPMGEASRDGRLQNALTERNRALAAQWNNQVGAVPNLPPGISTVAKMAGPEKGLPILSQYETTMATQRPQNSAFTQSLLDAGLKPGTPEWVAATKGEAARQMRSDPLSVQQLENARLEGNRKREELKRAQDGYLSDETVRDIAESVGRFGDTSRLKNIGRGMQGAGNLARVQNAITELNLSPQEKVAAGVQLKAATAAAQAQAKRGTAIDTSAEELNSFADQAIEASNTVNRGQFVPLNQLANLAREKTSDPSYTALMVAVQSARNAYAGVMARNGTPTVSYMQHADELLNAATSHEGLVSALKQMQREAVAAQEATRSVQGNIFSNAFPGSAPPAQAPAAAPAAPVDYKSKYGLQ